MTVAGFIQINARQSMATARGGLAPALDGAFIEETHVCHLHCIQKGHQRAPHTLKQ